MKNLLSLVMFGMLISILFNVFSVPTHAPEEEVIFSDFMAKLDKGDLEKVIIKGNHISGIVKDKTRIHTFSADYPDLMKVLREKDVQIEVKPPDESPWYVTFLVTWGPFILFFLLGLWVFLMRQMRTGENSKNALVKSQVSRTLVGFGSVKSIDASQPSSFCVPPIIPRNVDNPWAAAEQRRDIIHGSFQCICKRLLVNALILKSSPAIYPPWVKFECWSPKEKAATLAERVSITVTINPKPYWKFPFEYHIDWRYGEESIYSNNVLGLDDTLLEQVIKFVLGRGPKPRLDRLREHDWQLWRRGNKFIASRLDLLGLLGPLLLVASLVSILWSCGSLLLNFQAYPSGGISSFVAPFLGIILGVLMWVGGRAVSDRNYFVLSQGKPYTEPRDLIRVDSWQSVVFDMAKECDRLRREFMGTLSATPTNNFTFTTEHVWYWGLDGPEEREQIVLSSGRGVVFCLIYPYGSDLYVGWSGYLNVGQWKEKTIHKGIDRITGELTLYRTIEPGVQTPTEYDVTDLSCLMEWTHAQLVKILKKLIEEMKIGQEIDFKILRGERQRLTEKRPERQENRFSGLFQRTG